MSIQTRDDLERLTHLAKREFSSALMSDTKWRKLFLALSTVRAPEGQMLVRFLEVDEVRVMRIPSESALWCPLPYIDTFEYGPVELRAIEWLEIPAIACWSTQNNGAMRQVAQDLNKFRTALCGLGQFPLVETSRGIRFKGYKR